MAIAVVGIGLDGERSLTPAARAIVQQARVLVGGKRHLSYFIQHPALKIQLADFQADIEAIAHLDSTEQSVVILASGDPLFFGLGRLLLERFDAAQIQFFPHVSAVQLAFSRLKVPWQDAKLISVHGRSTDELIKLLEQGCDKIALLTDRKNNPAAIARLYLALELPANYGFHICENLGSTGEKLRYYPSQELHCLCDLDHDNFAELNVLILLREAKDDLDLANLPIIGISDHDFLSFSDRPGLITKKEVRLAILGELSLQPEQTVWDIGAGTGSVSIEIARLCPSSRVYAVEKTSMGSTLVTKNSHRFQANNVININGKAPEALLNLPAPNRIFVGGSGGDITEILDVCQQKLAVTGKMVMAFATIEHQYSAINWLKDNSWQYRLLQLQISRSTPIAHLTRFTTLNPVTIITASRNQN